MATARPISGCPSFPQRAAKFFDHPSVGVLEDFLQARREECEGPSADACGRWLLQQVRHRGRGLKGLAVFVKPDGSVGHFAAVTNPNGTISWRWREPEAPCPA